MAWKKPQRRIPLAATLVCAVLSAWLPAVTVPAQALPCVPEEQIATMLAGWQAQRLGTADYLDPETTARFLAAYDAEPPASNTRAHAMFLFTFIANVTHPRFGPMPAGSAIGILVDKTGCAKGSIAMGPEVAKRVMERVFGKGV